MSRRKVASASQLFSRLMEIWLSVLSWMRWRRNRRQREKAQEELLGRMMAKLVLQQRQQEELLLQVEALRWQMADSNRALLLEALKPVALAMQRQDSLANQRQMETRELLLEVLNSLQPSAQAQLFPRIGQLPPRQSSPSLVS